MSAPCGTQLLQLTKLLTDLLLTAPGMHDSRSGLFSSALWMALPIIYLLFITFCAAECSITDLCGSLVALLRVSKAVRGMALFRSRRFRLRTAFADMHVMCIGMHACACSCRSFLLNPVRSDPFCIRSLAACFPLGPSHFSFAFLELFTRAP
jgi:hypothetical protein